MLIKLSLWAVLLNLMMVAVGYTIQKSREELIVSAAMSLKNVLEAAAKAFEADNSAYKVLLNFGASGNLIRQIHGGAPVDIIATASKADMDQIVQKGLAVPASRRDIAQNSLVLIVPTQSKLTFGTSGNPITILNDKSIKRIAIGNPMSAPVGKYAEEMLRHYGIYGDIKEKLIFCETVRQVLDYTAREEVDAGIVYSTDAALMPRTVRVVATASEDSHSPVVYSVAMVQMAANTKAAQAFIEFLASEKGRKIFISHGFK
ncbi:MAG: molybdate ABC transporter substrate-binding protein [Nitrospirae bacterium]|nr:molybdate ABC transporter substrate-binding protein [Nitrospirota bacterium]